MSKTTTVIPTLAFSEELIAAAKVFSTTAKKLETIARSLQKKAIDPSQAWYWTKEWQEAERQVEEDIKAGRCIVYDSVDNLIADLHKAAKKHDETR